MTDRSLILTQGINNFLREHPSILRFVTFVTSIFLDFVVLSMMIDSIFDDTSKEFLILWFSIVIRQISLTIVRIKPVPTLLWKNPGFPSIFVKYDIQSDFYFSGHTVCSVIGWLFLQRHDFIITSWLFLISEILFVATTHSHYYADILTGITTPLAIAYMIGY
jgi:hypothetical protein